MGKKIKHVEVAIRVEFGVTVLLLQNTFWVVSRASKMQLKGALDFVSYFGFSLDC